MNLNLRENRGLLIACAFAFLALLAVEALNPELAHDSQFNEAVGEIGLIVVLLWWFIGRLNTTSKSAGASLRRSIELDKAYGSGVLPDARRSTNPLWIYIGVASAAIVASLGVLYFLVRFVKWAWTD